MTYHVKEIFHTLQGEGARAGRVAVFCRFAGCNLWSGREQDRATALCNFCDTDFVGTDGQNGGRYNAKELADTIAKQWQGADFTHAYVVFTGGEPLLQLDNDLMHVIKQHGFEVAIETNGTLPLPSVKPDWICVSPKPNTDLVLKTGDEIKFIYPQPDFSPDAFSRLAFKHFFLQPMDKGNEEDNQQSLAKTLAYCQQHPQWRLSLQTHKIIGID